MSRVSTSQIFHQAHKNVADAREKEVASAEKVAKNKRITRPSQDPSGWLVAAGLKDSLAVRETLAKNAALAIHSLNTHESLFSTVQDNVQRAYEIAIQTAGENPSSSQARELVLADAKHLVESTITALNSRFNNRTVLGGYRTQSRAFDNKGKYLGDDGIIHIEITRGAKIPISISAKKAVFGEGMKNGVNVLATLQTLVRGMETNSTEVIRSAINNLNKANEQMSRIRAEVGSNINEIERALDNHAVARVDTMDAISRIEEADFVKAISDLARDRTVLQAALTTNQKLLNENNSALLFK